MKSLPAALLMLTGLAAGIGGRLLVASHAETGKPTPKSGTGSRSSSSLASAPAAARSPEQAILDSGGAARLRLLLAWLRGANAGELRQMADRLMSKDTYDLLPLRVLMTRWAEVDPGGMLLWARTGNQGRYLPASLPGEALAVWAGLDFESAWAAALSSQPAARGYALLGLIPSDPARVKQMLLEDPALLDLRGMGEVIANLTARDPAAATALLESVSPARQVKLAGEAVLAWAKTDPAASAAWLATLDAPIRAATTEKAVEWFAKNAPDTLPALMDGLPPGRTRSILEAAGLAHLVETDPGAARLQVDAMPDSVARQYGRGLLLTDLVRHGDEAGALLLAEQLGWEVRMEWSPYYSEIVSNGSSQSFFNRDDDPTRKAMQTLLCRLAETDPGTITGILSSHPRIVMDFFSGSIETSPGALATVLLDRSGQEDMRYQLEVLTSYWTSLNPEAAASWALSRGNARLGPILQQWGNSDPAPAMMWAAKMPEAERLPLLRTAVGTWADRYHATLPAIIRESRLPAPEKQALLDSLPTP